jgi:acyl dehydratase
MNDTLTAGEPDLAVGAVVPPFRRTAGLHAWNRYAAVNDEFVDIHMDAEAGRAAGMPGAIGMGNLVWAWMHAAVAEWLGERGRLEHLECRFKAPALQGDVITCTGTVTDRREEADGTVVLDLELWAEKGDGQRIAPGTARVLRQVGTVAG